MSPVELFVSRLNSLSALGPEERSELAGLRGDIIQVPANADVVQPGDDIAHLYLVVEGVLGRFTQFRNGKRQITVIHIVGDAADVHAVAAPGAASPMQALTTSTLIRLPIRDVRAIARGRPAVIEAFWAYAAVDAAVLTRWAANLGQRSAVERMAHFLCEMGMRMENAERGTRLNFMLEVTQAQLGDVLGLTSVHVNRTLKSLRDDGLVKTSGRNFQVQDWPALAALGDFDGAYLQIDDPPRAAA